METMISSVWTIAWTVANILVLYLLLKLFLFKPLNKMLEKRQALIKSDLDDASKSKAEAEELKKQYEENLAGAKEEAREIVAKADVQAKAHHDKEVEDTRNEVAEMKNKAFKEIELEKQKSLDAARDEISSVALEVAAKVMGRSVNTEDNARFIEDFLSEEASE